MKIVALDPAEEWLAQHWLGNLYSFLSRKEIAKEIKIRLFEYIYNLLKIKNQFEPPFNPDFLFQYRKILEKNETNLPSNRSGMIIPTLGGFIMRIKSDEHYYRKRFTIAHEIGHTFFYDINEKIPVIRFNKSKSRYWLQEDYANEIAAALLLPEPSLRKVIVYNKLSPSLEALEYLSKLYEVSFDVLHRRIVRRLGIWDCVIFKSTMDPEGTIKIDSASISKGLSYRDWNIPKFVRKDSIKSVRGSQKKRSWNIPKILREKLYFVLSNIFKDKRFLREFMEEKLEDKDKEGVIYLVQSKLVKDNDLNSSISLIIKKEG